MYEDSSLFQTVYCECRLKGDVVWHAGRVTLSRCKEKLAPNQFCRHNRPVQESATRDYATSHRRRRCP